MSLIKWEDAYNVGIEKIDLQHQKILEMINGLEDFFDTGKMSETTSGCIKELIDFIRTHFTFEERLMHETGYPVLDQHRILHKKIITQISGMLIRINKGKRVDSSEVMPLLKEWLLKHIDHDDRQYSKYLQRMAQTAANNKSWV